MAPRQWAGRTIRRVRTVVKVDTSGGKENQCKGKSESPEGGRSMRERICEAVEKFTRFDGDVWRLCVRDLLSSEVETLRRLLATSPCFLTLPLSLLVSFVDFLLITGRFIGPPAGIPVFRSIGRVDDWDARTTDGIITGSNLVEQKWPVLTVINVPYYLRSFSLRPKIREY